MPSVKEIIMLMTSPNKEDMTVIEKAYAFAEKAHEGLKRYSGEPFFIHVFATAKKLAEFGMGAKAIAAGLLHDVIEDTKATREEVEKEFGPEILSLVDGVTKLGTLKYHGMKRHTESLRKLFVAIAKDIRVLIIKLTDRLHNMETLHYVPAHKQRRIAEETLEIYAPLAYRLGMRTLNRELEDLAFPYVYPKEYREVRELLKEHSRETQQHLEKVRKSLQKELAKEGMREVKTESRIKGVYSLYKKLLRKNMDMETIHDISALRVIVPTVADCYKALGILHGMWRPLPGRIKDYIAFPKPNGYQSIHTTIFTGDGGIVEIQIRSVEMHREAEYGIASHLGYKEGVGNGRNVITSNLIWIASLLSYRSWFQSAKEDKPTDTSEEPSIPSWLTELAEAHADTMEPQEFLEGLRADFFEHRIFVFTPKGDVVDLPLDSSPIDFAYAIHSDIGNHVAGAKVNGKLVSLDTKLKNGDIVDIQTKNSNHPTGKWLEFAKTEMAKRKIRAALGERGR